LSRDILTPFLLVVILKGQRLKIRILAKVSFRILVFIARRLAFYGNTFRQVLHWVS
jgi:hypothetical protein